MADIDGDKDGKVSHDEFMLSMSHGTDYGDYY